MSHVHLWFSTAADGSSPHFQKVHWVTETWDSLTVVVRLSEVSTLNEPGIRLQ